MKILIAIPTYENIYPDTYKSVWDMDKYGHECLFEFVRGYDVAAARNRIAFKAMELEVDAVMMVDNDVVVPQDTLKHFTEDIKPVQFAYMPPRPTKERERRSGTVIFKNDFNDWKHPFTNEEIWALRDDGIKKVSVRGGGLGCALIQTDVFRKLNYPYFQWVNSPFGPEAQQSEDLFFCEQCLGYHIPVYLDTRINCGHLIRYIQY